MSREQFKNMQMAALESLKNDVEACRKNPGASNAMRDDMESQYRAILQKQAEWERGGFWSPENEKKYAEKYKEVEA
jgi:hypothetical protein